MTGRRANPAVVCDGLRPCLACDRGNRLDVEQPLLRLGDQRWRVICHRCDVWWTSADSIWEARLLWNQRTPPGDDARGSDARGKGSAMAAAAVRR